jgi:DNA-binding transcriptional MerR regulator
MKRRGNRRYYQHHEVLMIRRIRDLLYDQGFTISGARNRLQELAHSARDEAGSDGAIGDVDSELPSMLIDSANRLSINAAGFSMDSNAVRKELFEIRALLSPN